MSCAIEVTPQFERDFESTLAYLSIDLAAPASAEKLYESMDHALELLADMPGINPVSRKPALEAFGYREHKVEGYEIVYRYSSDTVFLVRFLHQTQDIDAHIRS